jgi:uncharacterized membrane protein
MSEASHTSGPSTPAPVRARPGRGRESGADDSRDTTRLEAFSDGVFAVAITLLVLTFKVPTPSSQRATLVDTLRAQWPAYLAYATSFFAILLMWIAHHNMFRHIVRTDHLLLLINGLLLMGVTVVPFPTALLAEYLQAGRHQDQQTAMAVCCGTFGFVALMYNLLYWRAVGRQRLTDPNRPVRLSSLRLLGYTMRPWIYLGALVLALSPLPFGVQVSLVIYTLLALLYVLPPPRYQSVPASVVATTGRR